MGDADSRPPVSGDPDITAVLAPIRERRHLPALAAAVVLDGKVRGVGAVGVRKHGAATAVTASDRFHIGSCTKAMTATLIGMLVEEGKLSWEQTLADSFPELKEKMHPSLRTVTLAQLLAHRAGFASESWPKGKSFRDLHALPGNGMEQRRVYVDLILREEPAHAPGTKYEYANRGYAVAGAIAERAAKMPWEQLMTRRLFRPLGMDSAGFGAPGRAGAVDQPWAHRHGMLGLQPVEPGPLADNPAAIGPGGTVHASLGDWAKFALLHVAAGQRPLVKPDTLKALHTPRFGGDYAGGWLVTQRKWGGRVLTHSGSNTMNFAVAWLSPEKRFAVLVATNRAGEPAEQGTDEAAAGLIRKFLD